MSELMDEDVDGQDSVVEDSSEQPGYADTPPIEEPNKSPEFRWAYWSTTAAAVILIGTYGTWLWLLAHNATRPESLDFMMIIGLMFALIWTFGKDTADAVKNFREGEE